MKLFALIAILVMSGCTHHRRIREFDLKCRAECETATLECECGATVDETKTEVEGT